MTGIAPLALAQLEAWERIAREWPIETATKDTDLHLVCRVCQMTLIPMGKGSHFYVLTTSNVLAAVVAHLRIGIHQWVEDEVNGGNQNATVGYHARGHSTSNRGSADTD